MKRQASSIVPPEPPYSSGIVTPSQPSSAIWLVDLEVVVLAVAVGEPLALVLRAALALAEVADRVDEVALLVGQGEVHGGEPISLPRTSAAQPESPERDSNS